MDRMSQLVCQQSPALAIFGPPLAGSEKDVAAVGEGARADLLGRSMCGLVVMNAHSREVGAELGSEFRLLDGRQRRAGVAVKGGRHGRSGRRRGTRRHDRCGLPRRSFSG